MNKHQSEKRVSQLSVSLQSYCLDTANMSRISKIITVAFCLVTSLSCQDLTNVEVFNQEITWRNSACTGVYTGELSPSLRPQGFGTFSCRSHNYTGDWDRGLRHGRGVNTFSNGDTYTGQWAGDKRHGEGVIRWAGGRVYTGAMAGGRMEGVGEMTWPSGDKYIGDWEADTRTGHGLYLYSSGNRYKGQYLNNKKVVTPTLMMLLCILCI